MNGIIWNHKFKNTQNFHQTNGWEIFVLNEIIDSASNPHKNILFIDPKEIEPYDVSYENFA